MENAPVNYTNTCEKTGCNTGFKVEICKESPENPVLKHATVLRWGSHLNGDAPVDVIFLA